MPQGNFLGEKFLNQSMTVVLCELDTLGLGFQINEIFASSVAYADN